MNHDAIGDVEVTDDELVALLAAGERDLVAEYRDRAARAEAELKNFRTRVERDRAANREVVIAEVIRSLLPAIDDLDRAEAHETEPRPDPRQKRPLVCKVIAGGALAVLDEISHRRLDP